MASWTQPEDERPVDMPSAEAAHELHRLLRNALSTGDADATARVYPATRRLVRELRDCGIASQTVLLQVKEILQRASLGTRVDDAQLALWKSVIDFTIREYYRAD